MYMKQRKGQVVVCPKIKLPTCAFTVELVDILFDENGLPIPEDDACDTFLDVRVLGLDKNGKDIEQWVWMSSFRVYHGHEASKSAQVQVAKVALWKGVQRWFYSNLSFEKMLANSESALALIRDVLGQFIVADALLDADEVVGVKSVLITLDEVSLGILLGFIIGPLQARLQPIKNTYRDLIARGLDQDLSDLMNEALTDIAYALGRLLGDMEGSDGSFNDRANFLPSYFPVSRTR